jgi:U3 small nucleolar RNA-associated protein 6
VWRLTAQDEAAWDLLARRHVDFPAVGAAGEEAEAGAAEAQLERERGKPAGLADGGEAGPGDMEQGEEEAGGAQRRAADGPAGPWDADAHRRACAVYDKALTAAPTARMYELYGAFLCGELDALVEAERAAAAAGDDAEGGTGAATRREGPG